jgi:hypothetical protein
MVRSVFRTRSRVHPALPNQALHQESQQDPRDDQSCACLTDCHPHQWSVWRDSCGADSSVQGGAAGEEYVQQRHLRMGGPPPRTPCAAFPSGAVARLPCQQAEAEASSAVWGDDDIPPVTGLSPPSHEPTRVCCPAGQKRHPQGKPDPCPFPPPLPAHRTPRGRTRSGSGSAPRVPGTLACHHDRQATSVTAASLLAGRRWVARACWPGHAHACSGTQPRKRRSAAGARGRLLESPARWHFSAVARSGRQTPR